MSITTTIVFSLLIGILLLSITLPFFAHAQIMKAVTVRLWLKALFAPFAVTTICLLLSGWFQSSDTRGGSAFWLVVGLSVSLGTLSIARLLDKHKTWVRAFLILIYALVTLGILFFYSLYFVCFFFHDCL